VVTWRHARNVVLSPNRENPTTRRGSIARGVGQKIRELRLKRNAPGRARSQSGVVALGAFELRAGAAAYVARWLRKISKALGVSVSDLIPESRTRKPSPRTRKRELLGHWRRIGNPDLRISSWK
jgi:hypothetical protein